MFGILRDWFGKQSASQSKNACVRSFRPVLQRLEDRCVPTVAVGDFAGGISRYTESTGWQNLTPYHSSQISVDSRGDVVGVFQNQGVVRFDATTHQWTNMTHAMASRVGVYDHGFVGEFQGQGVFRWDDRTGWQNLHTADASILKVDDGGQFAGEFPGWGVWIGGVDAYGHSGGVTQLNALEASQLDISANGQFLAADFTGRGVYRYATAGGGWQQLTQVDSTSLAVNSNGYVAASFPYWGVYRTNDQGGWNFLSSNQVSEIHMNSSQSVGIEIGGHGIWEGYSQYGWHSMNSPGDATTFDMRG